MNTTTTRPFLRYFVGLFFALVGVSHLLNPAPFLLIMPPYLPWPEGLVAISGVAEICGGVGLFLPRFRRPAGWGLTALLIAVFPANIHMLVNEVYIPGMPHEIWLLWARLPLQLFLIGGVLWAGGIWPRSTS
jgi:uncharacterized membrane protein